MKTQSVKLNLDVQADAPMCGKCGAVAPAFASDVRNVASVPTVDDKGNRSKTLRAAMSPPASWKVLGTDVLCDKCTAAAGLSDVGNPPPPPARPVRPSPESLKVGADAASATK